MSPRRWVFLEDSEPTPTINRIVLPDQFYEYKFPSASHFYNFPIFFGTTNIARVYNHTDSYTYLGDFYSFQARLKVNGGSTQDFIEIVGQIKDSVGTVTYPPSDPSESGSGVHMGWGISPWNSTVAPKVTGFDPPLVLSNDSQYQFLITSFDSHTSVAETHYNSGVVYFTENNKAFDHTFSFVDEIEASTIPAWMPQKTYYFDFKVENKMPSSLFPPTFYKGRRVGFFFDFTFNVANLP